MDVDGRGQTVAVIELGGGFRPRDLEQYFTEHRRAGPEVVSVGVDGGRNAPTGDAAGPDGEVMLDIEVVGAVAPGARIAVYFAPNTSRGFLNAVLAAVHDRTHAPSVISISWGAPESDWTHQSLRAMDEAFQAGALLGVTICAAAGDSGSSDGVDDGGSHVDFPASSPHVLACGGTQPRDSQATIVAGRRCGAGRGERRHRRRCQRRLSAAGVAGGCGCPALAEPLRGTRAAVSRTWPATPIPETGYRVRVDGKAAVIGGTSAVSPLLAALVALINQDAGQPVGFLNPLLYGAAGQHAVP